MRLRSLLTASMICAACTRLRPDIIRSSSIRVTLGDGSVEHELAALQHDDAVGDLEDLLDVVGDEQHGRAGVGDGPRERPDLRRLGEAEGRGRLVHDHEVHAVAHDAQDLDDLALAAGQQPDRAVQRRPSVTPSSSRRARAVRSAARDVAHREDAAEPRPRLAAEGEVVGHAQVGAQRQLLEDDLDAGVAGEAGVARATGAP